MYFTQCAAKKKEHSAQGLVHPSQLTAQQKQVLEVQKQQARASKAPPQQAVPQIGAQQVRLVKPPQPLVPPVQPQAQPVRPQVQPAVQPVAVPQGQVMVPPQQAMLPFAVPMNFSPPSMQMPGYLTVPEPAVEGQAWYIRLGLNVARGCLKSAGHVIANWFDHQPFNPWPTNGGQG
jgi:hypothetical protein